MTSCSASTETLWFLSVGIVAVLSRSLVLLEYFAYVTASTCGVTLLVLLLCLFMQATGDRVVLTLRALKAMVVEWMERSEACRASLCKGSCSHLGLYCIHRVNFRRGKPLYRNVISYIQQLQNLYYRARHRNVI